MDSRTRSAFGRLEIVETGRRGRWSEDEKARIVLESLAGHRGRARPEGLCPGPPLMAVRRLRARRRSSCRARTATLSSADKASPFCREVEDSCGRGVMRARLPNSAAAARAGADAHTVLAAVGVDDRS